jgi:hypothetical protein
MKKSTRRLFKKAARNVRKQLKNVARPLGGGEAALVLGGVAAAAALSPDVRARTKHLAIAAIDRLQVMIAGASDGAPRDEHAIARTDAQP